MRRLHEGESLLLLLHRSQQTSWAICSLHMPIPTTRAWKDIIHRLRYRAPRWASSGSFPISLEQQQQQQQQQTTTTAALSIRFKSLAKQGEKKRKEEKEKKNTLTPIENRWKGVHCLVWLKGRFCRKVFHQKETEIISRDTHESFLIPSQSHFFFFLFLFFLLYYYYYYFIL